MLCVCVLLFRLARGRDEWESAMLQNANTRCNGILPIWGPEVSSAWKGKIESQPLIVGLVLDMLALQVTDSTFASSLAR